jgi:predicted metal-binding protein
LESCRDAASPPETSGVVIYVCTTCRLRDRPDCEPRPGTILAQSTIQAAQAQGVAVRTVECLANCSRGASAAMRSERSWTYVFGELDETCAEALVEGALLLADAKDGLRPWRGRPEALKRGLIARVPPAFFGRDFT